jgi:tellurite resistance protein TerC
MTWLTLAVIVVVLLAIDLLVVRARGGVLSLRGATVASLAWIAVALAFGVALLLAGEPGQGQAYLTGYLVEKTLSIDNVFVFLLVFSAFGIAEADRHRLLTVGILLALVLRAGAIVAGAALLEQFSWVSFVFAALLAWTAAGMLRHRHDHDGEAKLVEGIVRRLPLSGTAAALAAMVVVDLIFAVDSVPAILAITDDTFVVFAANAFALLGLRPLFFLVEDLVARLPELKTALALVLAFIAVKLVLGELVGKIGPEISLPVVAAILGWGVMASLRTRRRAENYA